MFPRRSLSRLARRMSSMSTPPAHWKRVAPHPPKGSITFAAQDTLAKLPVPELADTFARLRRSLRPLARSEEEIETTEKKIRNFEADFAKVLHGRLLQRQQETEHWLEEWWDNGAYMGYRDSVRHSCYPCPGSFNLT